MLEILKKIPVLKVALLSIATFIIFFFLFQNLKEKINPEIILAAINIKYFLLAVIISLISFPLGASRWFFLLKMTDYKIKFKQTLSLVLASSAISLIPGRLGDFAKIYPIRQQIPMQTSTHTIILEKIIDIFSLLTISLLGFILIKKYFLSLTIFIIILSIALFVLIVYKIYKKTNKSFKIFDNFWEIIEKIKQNKINFCYSILSSFVNWLVSILMLFILFIAFDQYVNFAIIMSYFPLAIFFGLVPISLAGMGTREASLIFFLSTYNIPASIILLAGLSYSLIAYIIFSLVGLPFFIKEFKKN